MAEVYEIKDDEGIVLEVLGNDDEPAGEASAPTGGDVGGETPTEVGPTATPYAAPEPTADDPAPTATPQAALSIASRESWGARYQDGDLTLTGLAVEVFVHHSVTAQLSPDASIAAEAEQMRALESVGQSRFGTGISYNVVIFPSGRAYQGVSWNRRGTHTGGRNSTSRSICFAGNYETNQPTAAQISTAAAIYREGKQRWWTQGAPLYGHRDVSQTACPGRNLYARLDDIRAGSGTTPPSPGEPGGLVVDGFWGSSTTRRVQQELGTTVDGVVSSQSVAWRDSNPGLTTGWQWVTNADGSRMIAALQRTIGMASDERDGKIGPQTIRALQRYLGTPVDGVISRDSSAVMALQHRLNAGRI
ncbi:N-acetylmuramoyl-L-alanine amidase [Promicromonospora sp. NPDC057138]|uniref:peptidoglycan recognition protein family protein n=1 Tax=Promicromonospora sp. NPDC057138 TaxID=3346031 RepID=UPI003639732B